jgi:hypothetical protein
VPSSVQWLSLRRRLRSDERQAALIKYFSQLTGELGANFAFRIYDEDGKGIGSKTFEVTQSECQKRAQFYPTTAFTNHATRPNALPGKFFSPSDRARSIGKSGLGQFWHKVSASGKS